MIPAWVSWVGLAEHAAVGGMMLWVLASMHTPPVAIFVAVLALGIAKEWGEEPNDFAPGNGGPLNGILDVLAFLPGPTLYWIVH
jgi:hypothetical protein